MDNKKQSKEKIKNTLDEKFIPGSIESQYDNYFSCEEEADEKEKEHDI